jgi:hypothetical protein
MFLLIRAGILCFLCITSYYTYAITTLIQKKEVQQFIRHMEQKHGFAAK